MEGGMSVQNNTQNSLELLKQIKATYCDLLSNENEQLVIVRLPEVESAGVGYCLLMAKDFIEFRKKTDISYLIKTLNLNTGQIQVNNLIADEPLDLFFDLVIHALNETSNQKAHIYIAKKETPTL